MAEPPGVPKQRLAKVLARAGVASRRGAEELIRQGRVTVGGRQITTPALLVDPLTAVITVDGRPIGPATSQVTVVALHKPAGWLVTRRDPRGRKTIFALLRGAPANLLPVGRLDYASRGLLLCTDDGDLAHRLTHPRYGVWKTYHVRVTGRPAAAALTDVRQGIALADGPTAPLRLTTLRTEDGDTWLEISLREGRNRQIRRMLATIGHPVQDLVRIAVGSITLGDLAPGRWRQLSAAEVGRLRAAVGLAAE